MFGEGVGNLVVWASHSGDLSMATLSSYGGSERSDGEVVNKLKKTGKGGRL